MTVDIKGLKMGDNTNPNLVILHGLMGGTRNWTLVGKELAQKYEVHILNLRNHISTNWAESMAWQHLTEDLKSYLDNEPLKGDFILMGHSMGGKMAMHFASVYPDLVEKLIVVDMAPKEYPLRYKVEFEALMELNLESLRSRKEASELLIKKIPSDDFRESLLTNLERTSDGYQWRTNLRGLYDGLNTIRENPLSDNFLFTKETLFIKGQNSDFIADSDVLKIKKYFPRMHFVELAGVGHNPHAENKEALLQSLYDWL